MPQPSYEYAVARIRVHEKALLGRDKILRLAEGSLEDVVRLLTETGYGGMQEATAEDCEAMIAAEMEQATRLVREVTPEPALTELFLISADVHNLKVLIKARLLENDDAPVLMAGGLYGAEQLAAMVRSQDYRLLPGAFRESLFALERELLNKVNPQHVSVALDRAYLNYAGSVLKEHPCPFAESYFKATADFNNVLALLRVKSLNAGKDMLADVLLPGGGLTTETLLLALEQSYEMLAKTVSRCEAGQAIAKGLELVQQTGRASALEKARDDFLMELAKTGRYDMHTLRPIIGYLLAREQEAKCIRVIVTAKRNRLPDTVITERLRELYG